MDKRHINSAATLDARYKKMLVGQKNDKGIIINTKWFGNNAKGVVEVIFNNGSTHLYKGRNGFRPTKRDFNLSH